MDFFAAITAGVLWASAGYVRSDDAPKPLDNEFLIKAATANHAEIEISKLADRHASSSQVKTFADRLVKDHQAVYRELAELLKNRKVGVVAGLEKDTRDELKRLGNLEGGVFDQEYLRCIIAKHQEAIDLFAAQSKSGKESDIRDFAQKNLPGLRKHLSRARELANEKK